MAEHLTMSQKERTRLGVMREIKAETMSLVAAARVLRLGYRQMKRVWGRYQDQGDAGLVHRSRGRASNRAKAALVNGPRQLESAAAAPKAPAVARTQGLLWRVGADGWFAPRLVRGPARPSRADGDDR